MNDRILNILLISFIFLLGLNLFMPKPEKAAEPTEPYFSLTKTSVVVPNYPGVTFKNPTASEVIFDTCKNLSILKDLKTVKLDTQAASAFCKEYRVPSKGESKIDLSPLTALFVHPGNVGFKLTLGETEVTSNIVVEERGVMRTLMAAMFYAPILNLFVGILQNLPSHSLGLAIIIITLIVRIILLVPQHHMMLSARKMQDIQPKVKALQDKHKGDQAKLGMELMELYKRENVNPLGSCLPLLIQTPILIVLYWVLISIQDHSNDYYLYSFFKDFDVSKIEHMFLGMDLLAIGGVAAVVLAVVVGVTQWLQIWLSQKRTQSSTKKEVSVPQPTDSLMPDPEIMNKFMLWGLPVIIAFSVLYFPIGVGLYWFIGTLFMLVQQAVVNHMVQSKKTKGELIV